MNLHSLFNIFVYYFFLDKYRAYKFSTHEFRRKYKAAESHKSPDVQLYNLHFCIIEEMKQFSNYRIHTLKLDG